MAEIKLISIKRNEEASYFNEKSVPEATLDSNRNNVVEIPGNRMTAKISKKAQKEKERQSKKEQKQKIKEAKQREKVRKKSLKQSRKEVIGTVDRVPETAPYRVGVINDNDVTVNGGFQIGMDVGEQGKIKKAQNNREEIGFEDERPSTIHVMPGDEKVKVPGRQEMVANENFLVSNANVKVFSVENEVVSNERENLSNRDVVVSGKQEALLNHEELVVNHNDVLGKVPTGVTIEHVPEHVISSDLKSGLLEAQEETITVDQSETTEEVPDEFLSQPKTKPVMLETVEAQYVEIEITEVTDAEGETSNSNQEVVMQDNLQSPEHMLSENSEGQILSSTVQQVEFAPELDTFLAESYAGPTVEGYKQERRKSVRFRDITEEIGHIDVHLDDHEYAFEANAIDNDNPPHTLNPVVEIVNKEKRGEIQSCPEDFHDIFMSYEPKAKEAEDASDGTRVEVVKVNGDIRNNGDAKFDNGHAKMVEISLSESSEHENTFAKRKHERKRSGFIRCCFP